jgi:hypothetical protein
MGGNVQTLPFGGGGLAQTTITDLCYSAYRIAGILLRPGRGNSQIELIEAVNILNTMIDEWNTQRLLIYAIQQFTGNMVPGQQEYFIGSGAVDFVTPRPSHIDRASVIYLQPPGAPLELPIDLITEGAWQSIPQKQVQSPIPLQLWYNPTFPAGSINLWPIPSVANQLALYLWQQLSFYSSITSPVFLPQGYLKTLQYNLAVEIALRWPTRANMSPKAMEIADSSKAWLKTINIPMEELACDEALVYRIGGMWNWRTGDWQR